MRADAPCRVRRERRHCGAGVSYTAGIVRNRPLVDGNERTAFVVGILFLELNGRRFTATEEDALRFVPDLAAGTIDEVACAGFLRGHVTAGSRSPRVRQTR
jgi:death-on-curing protein